MKWMSVNSDDYVMTVSQTHDRETNERNSWRDSYSRGSLYRQSRHKNLRMLWSSVSMISSLPFLPNIKTASTAAARWFAWRLEGVPHLTRFATPQGIICADEIAIKRGTAFEDDDDDDRRCTEWYSRSVPWTCCVAVATSSRDFCSCTGK